jgi:membrane associated rhomboid family serine protease
MSYDSTEPGDSPPQPQRAAREPIFNAPWIVVVMSLLLVALYAAYSFASASEQVELEFNFALVPQRFWAPAGSDLVYPDVFSGLLTLISTALLHANWMHVIVNSLMLLAFGTPVARAFGTDFVGAGLWMILFLGAVIAGSLTYLALRDVNAGGAVGASGGTSGLMGAAFLLGFDGERKKLWAREFLTMSVAFAIANVALAFASPYLLGSGLAWEAHAGGYVAGALLMAVLPLRGYRAAES